MITYANDCVCSLKKLNDSMIIKYIILIIKIKYLPYYTVIACIYDNLINFNYTFSNKIYKWQWNSMQIIACIYENNNNDSTIIKIIKYIKVTSTIKMIYSSYKRLYK